MKQIISVLLAYVLLFAVSPSYGQMMDHDHMKDPMGSGTVKTVEFTKNAKSFTKEAEAAGVTVKVTYKNPEEKKAPAFDVTLDTHSVELDQAHLHEIAILRDNAGREYFAEVVSSSGSGHHINAVFQFKDADISSAKFVELVIKGVAGIDERVFRFELEQ